MAGRVYDGLGKVVCFYPKAPPCLPWDYADEEPMRLASARPTPGQPKRLTKKVWPAIKSCVIFCLPNFPWVIRDVDLNWHLINCHYYFANVLKRDTKNRRSNELF